MQIWDQYSEGNNQSLQKTYLHNIDILNQFATCKLPHKTGSTSNDPLQFEDIL